MPKLIKHKTLANMSRKEFNELVEIAQLVDVQIRDMGQGYSLIRDKKRVGILTLETTPEEALHFIAWAARNWPMP